MAIDPVSNVIIGDSDEVLDDGTTFTHFSIIISDEAADVLKQPTSVRREQIWEKHS